MPRRKGETTGPKAASAAGKTLANPRASRIAKSAAASALAQTGTADVTGAKAASAAARTLANPKASAAAKSAAASALTQRPGRKRK